MKNSLPVFTESINKDRPVDLFYTPVKCVDGAWAQVAARVGSASLGTTGRLTNSRWTRGWTRERVGRSMCLWIWGVAHIIQRVQCSFGVRVTGGIPINSSVPHWLASN